MEQLYEVAGTSRQAHHQWQVRSETEQVYTPEKLVLEMANYVRHEFLPGSSPREVYYFIRSRKELSELLIGWGKHRFEQLCLNNGMRLVNKPFIPKTTIAADDTPPNLIEGIEIMDINQIWVSDMSFVFGSNNGKLLGFSTSIIDVYSRLLLGLHFSKTLKAEDTIIPAFEQALKYRQTNEFPDLFFHSDRGGQYRYKPFLSQLGDASITQSMAYSCYENSYAEAFNDTLKNHILTQFVVNYFYQLKELEEKIRRCYNEYKVHTAIGRMTPVEFEKMITGLGPDQRTKLKIKAI